MHLQDSDSSGVTGKYIALSHCWGGFKECQTTTANLAERVKKIEYASLPQTFKDAVYCALKLDVRYLWIDSLCIIQDDNEDWERESAKMSVVYSEAYLVIAAASAEADDIGFFTEPPSLYRGVGLESHEGSGQEDLVIHHYMPHRGSGYRSQPLSPISLGPLGNRAWTLQETLLARRCVGFNKNEVAWERHSALDCEYRKTRASAKKSRGRGKQHKNNSGTKWDYVVSHSGFSESFYKSKVGARPLTNLEDISATYREWRELIIPNYTKRQLTIPNDKLAASSAIATIIANVSGDEYLAGIWRNDINIGLAWRTDWRIERKNERIPAPCPTNPVGSSFSWIFVDETVIYHLPYHVKKDGTSPFGSIGVDVLDHRIPLHGSNPHGAVQGGWIRISALSHTFALLWDVNEKKYSLTHENVSAPNRLDFHADTMLVDIISTNNAETVCIQRAPSCDTHKSINALVEGILLVNIP